MSGCSGRVIVIEGKWHECLRIYYHVEGIRKTIAFYESSELDVVEGPGLYILPMDVRLSDHFGCFEVASFFGMESRLRTPQVEQMG